MLKSVNITNAFLLKHPLTMLFYQKFTIYHVYSFYCLHLHCNYIENNEIW